MNKELTIGIGTYGQKRNYIGRTLKSIIALLKKYRYTHKTIVVVYNDDSEYSLDYITALEYQEKYADLIKCIDNEKNLGIAKTYQKMCFQCQTPYFLQFDSDDIIGDFNIKQQVQFLKKNEKYCGSYGTKVILNEQGEITSVYGSQYNLINHNISINNNAMLLRVDDCKKTNFYFPDFIGDKVFDAALDIVMWLGMILKKPLFFDNTVRTYGLDWEDGNHIKNGYKYDQEFSSIFSCLCKKYGVFNDQWTVYEKQNYYFLFNKYLTKEQKKEFWNRIGQQRFQNDGLFRAYLEYLYTEHKYQQLFANMYLGLLKNRELQQGIVFMLAYGNLIDVYKQNFLQICNLKNKSNYIKENKKWLDKFFIKKKK